MAYGPWDPPRIGLVSDIHYCEAPDAIGRHYRLAPATLQAVVCACREIRVAAIVELGDMKDQDDPPDPARTRTYARRIEGLLHEAGVPVIHALGNHEVDCLEKPEFLELIREPAGVPAGAAHFRLDLAGVTWLVLDANFRPDGTALTRGHEFWTDPTLPADQIEWLERELAAASAPPVVVIHQRLDLDPPNEFAVRNSAAVRDVLERSGRSPLVVQGHTHVGDARVLGGVVYYTVAALVDSTPDDPSWALLETGRGTWRIRGYGRSPSFEFPAPRA